jgi:hypothetical protein
MMYGGFENDQQATPAIFQKETGHTAKVSD